MKLAQHLAFAILAATAAITTAPASAALYTSSYGTALAGPSDCDDCFAGPIAFGAGQSINFFGTTYNNLYVGSNGYVTFGHGASNYTSTPLDTQNIAPMIAGLFTDLDSRNDAASNVYVDNSVLGQLVVTWAGMGHFSMNYNVRSTFQLVVRSDEFVASSGGAQIGFYYGAVSDASAVSAGFGDGRSTVNQDEVAFASLVAGTTLTNSASRLYTLDNGTPIAVAAVPEPESIALLGTGLATLVAARRRRSH